MTAKHVTTIEPIGSLPEYRIETAYNPAGNHDNPWEVTAWAMTDEGRALLTRAGQPMVLYYRLPDLAEYAHTIMANAVRQAATDAAKLVEVFGKEATA